MHCTPDSKHASHCGCFPSQRSFRLRHSSQAEPGRCRVFLVFLSPESGGEYILGGDCWVLLCVGAWVRGCVLKVAAIYSNTYKNLGIYPVARGSFNGHCIMLCYNEVYGVMLITEERLHPLHLNIGKQICSLGLAISSVPKASGILGHKHLHPIATNMAWG